MTPAPYYKHSGKFGPLGLLGMLAGGGVAAGAIGVAYGNLVAWNPFVYINFLATLGAAGALGALIVGAAHAGKVRNGAVCGAVGLVAGLMLEYTQWWATLRFHDLDVAFGDVGAMWPMVSMLADIGPWEIAGSSPGGSWGFLAIWAIEGGILVVGATLVAALGMDAAFCERCETWSEKEQTLEPFDFVSSVEPLRARIDRGDLEPLLAFERIETSEQRYSMIELSRCPSCPDFHLASVKNVTVTEGDGETKQEETLLFSNILLSGSDYDKVTKL